MFCRRRDLLAFASLLGSIVAGAPSLAFGDVTLMWGIHRGCEPDKGLTGVLREKLEGATFPTTSLGMVPMVGSPQEAVRELKSACAGVSGRVLGGTIEPSEGRGFERFRLWLVDLATEQVASVDGVCPDKDCRLSDEVGWKAMELLDKPRFGALSDTPSFCQPPPPPVASEVVRSKRVTLVVQGSTGFRQSITAAVQRQVATTGREAVTWKGDPKQFFGYELLHKMLQGEPTGQILGISSTPKGASLWVFDGPSDQTYPAQLDCPRCTPEALADKAAVRGVALLDQVTRAEPPRFVPPDGACGPLVLPQCKQPSVSLVGMTPSTAKLVKGSVWGLFAASAATAITLAILNETSVGDQTERFQTFHHQLTPAARTMPFVAALSLAIAVPATVVVDKKSRTQPALGGAAPALTCPTR